MSGAGKGGADLGPGVRALRHEKGPGPLRGRVDDHGRPSCPRACPGVPVHGQGGGLRPAAAGSLRPVGKSDAVASQGVRGPRPPFKELSSVKPLTPQGAPDMDGHVIMERGRPSKAPSEGGANQWTPAQL